MLRVLVLLALCPGLVWAEATPEQSAEEIFRHADRSVQSIFPGFPGGAAGKPARDGVFVLASFSLKKQQLQALFDQSRLLGARVVFRGWPQNSFRTFVENLRDVIGLPDTLPHQPHQLDQAHQSHQAQQSPPPLEGLHQADVVIDPVLFRDVQVETVPALVVRRNDRWVVVTGAGPLRRHVDILARQHPEFQELASWFDRQHRGWLQGGPPDEPRPDLPAVTETAYGTTGLPGAAVQEESLMAFIQRRMASVDWRKKGEELRHKIEHRLKQGPGLALPAVRQSRVFFVDPAVSLTDDVRDHQGAVVAQAGTAINPLQHVRLDKTYIVFDGQDAAQVSVIRDAVEEHGRLQVKLMVTRGDVEQLAGDLQTVVYWASNQIIDRFRLEAVPSFIRQDGVRLRIEEVQP